MISLKLFTFAAILVLCKAKAIEGPEILETHPDVGLRVPELVAKYGYPIEIHTVQTSDNYILTVHRIPHGKNNGNSTDKKPVVFLMHGVLLSSADWVVMGPGKGLAYLLADLGYDVWMGNARGNTYSRKHATLDPQKDKKKFWNFSWHEIGLYDSPAMIDMVLEKTQEEKLFYIGHSQGTTSYFVMASSLPEYNNKIRAMFALAPIAFMEHIPNVAMRFMSKFVMLGEISARLLGAYEFLPSTEFMQMVAEVLCSDESIVQKLCTNILFLIAGFDKAQLNTTMLPVIMSNTPAGAATKQLLHYAHGINNHKFKQYDYGLLNCLHYKNCIPPEYELDKISSKVILFSGKNDLMSSLKDVDTLIEALPNVSSNIVDYDDFAHLDFIWAIDVVKLVYNRVFELMKDY